MNQKKLVSESEAAQYLGICVATLRAWRSTRRVKLQYFKIGRAVRYRIEDLEAFLQSAAMEG
jgi:excisionase family DNA binding protein